MKNHSLTWLFKPGMLRTRIRGLFIFVALGLLLLMNCKDDKDNEILPEIDIWVTGIEITQGIQTITNTVPLVAQRSTTVRVSLGTDSEDLVVGQVTGELTVTKDGVPYIPFSGVNQLPAFALPNPSRESETQTLNFELPAPTGLDDSQVDFEVTIYHNLDADTTNNTIAANNLSFTQLPNPRLLYVLIDYVPSGTGPPNSLTVQASVGDAMVRGIFPVDDSDIHLYESALMNNVVVFDEDYDEDGLVDTLAEASALMSTLSVIRELYIDSLSTYSNFTFIYGWLNESPMDDFGGLGLINGFSAFGNTLLYQYQRSYAHEVGHNFGLRHNGNIVSPEVGWDTDARLQDNPEDNNVSGRVKSGTFVDIMNSGPPTNSSWVDTWTHDSLYGRALAEISAPQALHNNMQSGNTANGTLILQGYFNGAGTDLLHLYPTLRIEKASTVAPQRGNGEFTAVVITSDGQRRSLPFSAEVCYEGLNKIRHGFFELLIPVPTSLKVQKVDILNTETRQRMGGFRATKPPSISILSPAKNSLLEGKTTVSWETLDPGQSSGERLVHLQYSPDGGLTWSALGVNISENSFSFNAQDITPTFGGKGIIKLYACDGLNTVSQTITGLSTDISD